MTASELQTLLESNQDANLEIELPNGFFLPPHFHITELAHTTKEFVDCGGTLRKESHCVLQTYVAHDTHHRLTAGKLAKIFTVGQQINLPPDAPVELEFQETTVATATLDTVEKTNNTLRLKLAAKQTDCLAKDKCGIDPLPDTSATKNEDTINFLKPTPPDPCCPPTGGT